MKIRRLFVFLFVIQDSLAGPVPGQDRHGQPPPKKQKKDYGPRCEMTLSEIKLVQSGRDDQINPFMECRIICANRRGPNPDNSIESYKLLVLIPDPFAVVLFVDFAKYPYDESKSYLVIGSPSVPNVDISLGSPHAQSSFSTTEDEGMLPTLPDSNYVIMLVRGITKSEAKTFHLWIDDSGPMKPRVLTTMQIRLLEKTMVDMFIVGSETAEKKLQYSSFWEPKPLGQTMFSSLWKSFETSTSDSSLSVCADEYHGFNAEVFYVRPESPGGQNNCYLQQDNDPEENSEPEENIQQLETLQTKFSPLHVITPQSFQDIKSPFDESWIVSCESKFPKKESILQLPSFQQWLRFPMLPSECRFKCAACTSYLAGDFRTDYKRKSLLMTTGYLSQDIYSNSEAVKNHEMNELHKEAFEFYQRVQDAKSPATVSQIIEDFEIKERVTFNETMNVVLFLYAEMKAGVSFKTHENLMVALRQMGANVGWLQHSDDAAQKITKVISRTLHFELLNRLVEENKHFSILVDSSTNSNQPFLAVYIKTLQNNRPISYFYSLVYMAQGEKARQMTDSLIEQIRLDTEIVPAFENFFKTRITSISSDGASVMVGQYNSFKVFIMEYIGRTIPNIVCLAYNLDRAYKMGIKQDKALTKNLNPQSGYDQAKLWQLNYFETFEKSTNDLYTYYASWGHKKWQHLLNTAEEMGVIPKRLQYVYNIRWSESHFLALEKIHHNYYALVKDLDHLSESTDMDKASQNTAINMYHRMTDKTYMVVLHEFLDILSTFKIASKLFQEASSIIVGKVSIVYNALNSMNQFKLTPGRWLQDFLSNVVCDLVCDDGECTLDMYDDCESVIISGMKLEHQYPVVLHYSEVRATVYNNLISSLKSYFKIDMLEAFEIFNPIQINLNENRVYLDGENNIESMYKEDETTRQYHHYHSLKERLEFVCKFYYIDESTCRQITRAWPELIQCLITNKEDLATLSEATQFWPVAFTKCNNVWTAATQKLVEYALVTSFSSAECERGFSIMNSIKTKRRSRLEKSTLDSIMKVRINGPEVKDFPAYKYTIEVLKSYVRVDDSGFQNRPAETEENKVTV